MVSFLLFLIFIDVRLMKAGLSMASVKSAAVRPSHVKNRNFNGFTIN